MIHGHVASGATVGATGAFTAFLRSHDRNYVALEMEGAGMMAAAQRRAEPANTLVLRGISDLADERKGELDKIGGGGLRKLGMTNALDYLLALIDAGALWTARSKPRSA